jgi:peptidoglycan/xylan/chitin deacetylase (PgdA/CDA1 family)
MLSKFANFAYKTKLYKLARPLYGGIGHIITLHRVVAQRDQNRIFWSSNLEVSTDYLEAIIQYFIKHKYDIISLDEMYRRLKANEIQRRFVVFTFDDGYEDNFSLAYPLFKKYNLPFAIYITKALIEMNFKCWWYDIEDIILCYNKINVADMELITVTKEAKEEAFLKIRSRIIHTPFESGYTFYRTLIAKYPPCKTYSNWEPMTKNQLLELNKDDLATLGAHTVNHYPLNKLQLAEATYEVMESKNYLEELLQKPVHHFSYPYGSTEEAGEREIEIVKHAGFITATSTRIANIFPEHKDHLCALPRIPLIETEDEKKLFQMSLSGLLPAYLHHRKRLVTV